MVHEAHKLRTQVVHYTSPNHRVRVDPEDLTKELIRIDMASMGGQPGEKNCMMAYKSTRTHVKHLNKKTLPAKNNTKIKFGSKPKKLLAMHDNGPADFGTRKWPLLMIELCEEEKFEECQILYGQAGTCKELCDQGYST